jgi:hypothetical protein|tara:strand:+ start:1217 stop:1732 length:516 start_codon:yes stop_codon:yes gene_type:complete
MSTIKVPDELTLPVIQWVRKISHRKRYLKQSPPEHVGKVIGARFINKKDFPLYKELKAIDHYILKAFGYKKNTPICKKDGWFLSYSEDGHIVHTHKDKNPDNENYIVRFNVIVSKPEVGGNPIIDGNEIEVEENEVWVCKAGEDFHSTTEVKGQFPRVMISFGHYINKELI